MESSSSYDSYSGGSSGSSYSGSSSDESLEHEWESHIGHDGELFYVKIQQPYSGAMAQPLVHRRREESTASNEERKRTAKKKTSRLTNLLKRKQRAAAPQTSDPNYSPPYSPAAPKLPDPDWLSWSSYTVELEVRPTSGLSGRKGTNYCESLLGFTAGTPQNDSWLDDAAIRHRVIVERLVPEGPLAKDRSPVQAGDWLEKLNGLPVTYHDLQGVLSGIQNQQIVQLCFRRNPKSLSSPSTVEDDMERRGAAATAISAPHGVLLLRHKGLTEDSPEFQDILFRYPLEMDSAIVRLRGVPATLIHVIPQLNSQRPISSTFVVDGSLINIAYLLMEDCLLITAAPVSWCSNWQLRCMTNQLGVLLSFQYSSAVRPFVEVQYADDMKRLLEGFFHFLQTGAYSPDSGIVDEFSRLTMNYDMGGHFLPLPQESQLDVTLTLNQLEALDYEDWDYSAENILRVGNIIGTAVFYKGLIVGTTFSKEILEKVGMYLRLNRIVELSRRHLLEELVLWREVFLNRDGQRHFLLVVGTNQTLLVALVENQLPVQPYDNQPDVLLIEEMQYFLEELEHLELSSTCEMILSGPSNPLLVGDSYEPNQGNNPVFQITTGPEPVLFTFLSLDWGTGVFVAPVTAQLHERWPDIARQFQESCLVIHQLFENTRRSKEDLQKADWGGPWSHKSMVALQEVSMLFTIANSGESPSRNPLDLSYWVAGRLFLTPKRREVYVCYRDGPLQDLVDLSFHLGFGVLP